MKDQTGRSFENLVETVAQIFSDPNTSVRKDVYIATEFGKRQFDVVIERELDPFGVMKVGVEARDHKKRADIIQIDGFQSKLLDCAHHIDKGILINRRGFSKNATSKAKRYGIHLFRLEDRPDEIRNAAFSLPIVVREHHIDRTVLKGEFHFENSVTFEKGEIPLMLFEGKTFAHFCVDAFNDHCVKRSYDSKIQVQINSIDIGGHSLRIHSASVEIYVITKNHFGFVNELPNSIVLKGESGQRPRFVLDADAVSKTLQYRAWPNFWDIQDAPEHFGVAECASVNSALDVAIVDQFFKNVRAV